MKQMKVKIAIMLLLALIVSSINMGIKKAEAENLTTVYGDAVTVTAGQEVKVPVLIKNNQGKVAGLTVKVTYDTDIMTPVKVEKGEILSGFSNVQFGDTIATTEEAGTFECVAYNEENYSNNGELFLLTFQMSDSVAAGSYELKLELTEHFDEKQDDVSVESENIIITVAGTGNPTQKPVTPPEEGKTEYVWQGEITGWGGSESYPSSANHEQGSGEANFYWEDLTNISFSRGYGCGLELMNPYYPGFVGAQSEMAQFIKTMKNLRIKVTLKNGGAASSWNWDTELKFPSGVEMALPDGYLDTGYFALFGNDDVITKVEIYDVGENGGQATTTPSATPKPNGSGNTGNSNNTGNTGNAGNAGNTGNAGNSSNTGNASNSRNTDAGYTTSSSSKQKKVKKPAKVTGLQLTWESKKLYIEWNGKTSNSGYQIQCAQNRKFTRGKKTKNSTVDLCRFSGLKKGKTYYVRVRAYKKSSGKKIYGKWSKVKKIKIK